MALLAKRKTGNQTIQNKIRKKWWALTDKSVYQTKLLIIFKSWKRVRKYKIKTLLQNNVTHLYEKMWRWCRTSSVPSALLFLFYRNNLANELLTTTTDALFIDNVSILSTNRDKKEAQTAALVSLDTFEWAWKWKLQLNADKSESIFF